MVAALTAWWVVRETDRRQAAREHARVIRERVAAVVAAGAMIPEAGEHDRLSAFWRSHAAAMGLVVELGEERHAMREWVIASDRRLFKAVVEDTEDPSEVAADINGSLVGWSMMGLPSAPPR